MCQPFPWIFHNGVGSHYNDIITSAMASQITSLTIVYPTFYSGADQRKQQSSASLAFVRGIHQSLVNSPHKRPVTRKMLPFDDVIMLQAICTPRASSLLTSCYGNAFNIADNPWFPSQRASIVGDFFGVSLNKLLNKQRVTVIWDTIWHSYVVIMKNIWQSFYKKRLR